MWIICADGGSGYQLCSCTSVNQTTVCSAKEDNWFKGMNDYATGDMKSTYNVVPFLYGFGIPITALFIIESVLAMLYHTSPKKIVTFLLI